MHARHLNGQLVRLHTFLLARQTMKQCRMHLCEPLLLKTPGADGFDNVTQQEALPCRVAIYAYVEPLRMGADGKLQPGKLRWMFYMAQAVLHQCCKQLGTCGATLTGG